MKRTGKVTDAKPQPENGSILWAEINEQPEVLKRFLALESANVESIVARMDRTQIRSITIAARGTSDNAATYGKYVFGSFNRLPVTLAAPSLYSIYHTPPNLPGSLVIGISQSGESPDILAVVEEAKRQHVPTIAVTNHPDSPLARTVDAVIFQHTGEEMSVAATKTYTSQLCALALLSATLAHDPARRRELNRVPKAAANTLSLDPIIEQAATRWRGIDKCLVIGRGYNYATALEIALKLKELTYIAAEPFSSADVMHGPVAIVHEGFPAIVVAPSGQVCDDLMSAAGQLKSRGADMMVISDGPEAARIGDVSVVVPAALPEWLSPITAVIPGQLLAYHLTIAKGIDPDHPRGLSKITRTL